MKTKYKYSSILRFGTLQFDGHVHDYFVRNSEKLVEYYILARAGEEKNFITHYHKGRLVKKKEVFSPRNIFAAYLFFYFQYIYILFRYFRRDEKFFIINSLPIFFFFKSIWRIFRRFEMVYWIHDFWPMNDLKIRIFRFFMYYYHKNTKYNLYVTDRINAVMNTKIQDKPHQHTVMLGMDMPMIRKLHRNVPITLAFIGVLKFSQGIEELLEEVALKKDLKLKIIGTGSPEVVKMIKTTIKNLGISKQIFFPNKFYYKDDLFRVINDCHIGVVLYEENKKSVTYYADPAKIKQYAEFGFPIITTNTPEIAAYIKQYKAGEVVRQDKKELLRAIENIQNKYPEYVNGIKRFCQHFSYEKYYDKKFSFLLPERDMMS